MHVCVINSQFRVAKIRNEPRGPSDHGSVKEMWIFLYSHTSKITIFVGKWMELDIIKLSEVIQTQINISMLYFVDRVYICVCVCGDTYAHTCVSIYICCV